MEFLLHLLFVYVTNKRLRDTIKHFTPPDFCTFDTFLNRFVSCKVKAQRQAFTFNSLLKNIDQLPLIIGGDMLV